MASPEAIVDAAIKVGYGYRPDIDWEPVREAARQRLIDGGPPALVAYLEAWADTFEDPSEARNRLGRRLVSAERFSRARRGYGARVRAIRREKPAWQRGWRGASTRGGFA